MAYSKNTWSKGQEITSAKLNNIETGLETADRAATQAKQSADSKLAKPAGGNGTSGQFLKSNGDGTTAWVTGSLMTGAAGQVAKVSEPSSAQAEEIATVLNSLIDALIARGIISEAARASMKIML